jgi:hypothetical protein
MTSALFGNMMLSDSATVGSDTQSGKHIQADVFEQALLRRVQAGDAEAFYELVRPHERAVFLAAVAIVKNEADAEEVAQEAVLKGIQNIGAVSPGIQVQHVAHSDLDQRSENEAP